MYKFWKFEYKYWYSVKTNTIYVKARTKELAHMEFDRLFGYETVDIKSVEEVTPQQIVDDVTEH